MTQTAARTDWKTIEEWNKKYVVRTFSSQGEYQWIPVESTEGDYLNMPDGTRLLDFFNQLYCVNIGQRNEYITERIKEALDRYGFVWDLYSTDYKATVAKMLVEDILGPYDWTAKVRFTNTGSEAVEVASIIAKLYTGKPLIASREHGYHGESAGAAALNHVYPGRSHLSDGARPDFVRGVPGQLHNYTFACPAPLCYRCSIGHTYPECKSVGDQLPCVLATERMIMNQGVDQVAAIITEPACGAGTIVPPDEYLPQIHEMKNRLGILWIVDEVLMGFGRLGTWFGHQKYGKELKPDLMTIAKGLTSSQIPAGGVVLSEHVAEFMDSVALEPRQHVLRPSHRHGRGAGQSRVHDRQRHPGDGTGRGEYFGAGLKELEAKHKTVGFIAGDGMFGRWSWSRTRLPASRSSRPTVRRLRRRQQRLPRAHRARQVPGEGRAARRVRAQHAAHRRVAHRVQRGHGQGARRAGLRARLP